VSRLLKQGIVLRSIAIPEVRQNILRIATAHGAGNVRVIGSIGPEDQGAASDLVLLVDMAEGRSLFDLVALSNDLEDSLEIEADVVTEASLSPYIRDRVLADAIALEGMSREAGKGDSSSGG
jgi:uncharacterized protein